MHDKLLFACMYIIRAPHVSYHHGDNVYLISVGLGMALGV